MYEESRARKQNFDRITSSFPVYVFKLRQLRPEIRGKIRPGNLCVELGVLKYRSEIRYRPQVQSKYTLW